MNRSGKAWLVSSALLAVLAWVQVSAAVGTRRIELETEEDLSGGDLQGVAIDSAGNVQAGFNLGNVPIAEGTTVWSALEADGRLLLGLGNEGKLVEVRGGTTKLVAESGALAITSMTKAWGDTIVIGTLPQGEVMQLKGDKLTTLAKLPDTDHVWAVAFDPTAQVVYAATGPDGKLFRITQNGEAQVHFDADEKHLMSVALSGNKLYAGASDRAKLYAITGPGRATVLYDFGTTEVRHIAVAQSGDVFAIANDIKAGSYTPVRGDDGGDAKPSKQPKTKGKGVLYRFAPDGTPEKLLDNDDEHFVSLGLNTQGRPYVGTGVEGRVYTVDDAHNSVLVADTEERQIGAVVLGGTQQFVVASDPVVVHPVRGIGGPDAVWTSKVLDIGLRAEFGQLSWAARGKLEFSTRSGNTEEPDDTWSEWSPPLADPGKVKSPAARYVQVRARWNRDAAAVLHRVTLPFVTDNLRAVITQVDAEGQDGSISDGDGETKSSGGPISDKPDHELSLSWKVDNPDDDELRFRLQYRLEGTNNWFDMLKPAEKLTKKSFTWDTRDMPEGRYRVRVKASDELANPPDRAKQHEAFSGVVLVDNTPPSIQGLAATGRRVRGTAVDGVGPIARIEISVAGSDEWVPFFPRDGIFDEQSEAFDADVSMLSAEGPVLLSIRVYDQNRNFVVRSLMLK